MEKYIVLIGFCIGAGIDVLPGDIVDLPAWDAEVKLQGNQVRKYTEPAKKPAAAKTAGGADNEA